MISGPQISNPKRVKLTSSQKDAWFNYYAGFSTRFVTDAIRAMELPEDAVILDPWNGSGTTTSTAQDLGFRSMGIDINPVMIIVARAKLLSKGVSESLVPLADKILAQACLQMQSVSAADPLTTWFVPTSAGTIRAIADAVTSILTKEPSSLLLCSNDRVSQISDLASFYLVALFRTVRDLLHPFKGTNPTWIKTPLSPRNRIRPDVGQIRLSFKAAVEAMSIAVTHHDGVPLTEVRLGNSSALPADIGNVNAVISSPPYCTRIDYAVATKPELAVLGCPFTTEFRELRRRLIGGPVVNATQPSLNDSWGQGCLEFLDQVNRHPSKGSKSYYYKLFLQYFGEMHRSMEEIDRVINSGGQCILVVQDSHYKAERIDIARYLVEMGTVFGWKLRRRIDFETALLMARLNPRSRKYRRRQTATESVLWFDVA